MAAPSPGGLINSGIQPANNVADLSGTVTGNAADALGAPSATGATPQASTYDPAMHNVAGNELVSNQVNSLVSADNPLMQTARSQANDAGNSRGLLNSSMTTQAGEQAVINTALPIAQADAATYSNAAGQNQAAANTAGQFNAGSQNQFGINTQQAELQAGTIIPAQTEATKELQAQSGGIQSGLSAQSASQTQALAKVQADLQAGLITAQEAADKNKAILSGQIASGLSSQQAIQDLTLQGLRGDQAQALADTEAQWHQLIQSSASAGSIFQTTMTNINAILQDPNTTAEEKQNAINNAVQLLTSGLSVIGGISNVDLGGLLNFNTPAAGGNVTGGATVGGTPAIGGGTPQPGIGGTTQPGIGQPPPTTIGGMPVIPPGTPGTGGPNTPPYHVYSGTDQTGATHYYYMDSNGGSYEVDINGNILSRPQETSAYNG